jgi:hypothetical protein
MKNFGVATCLTHFVEPPRVPIPAIQASVLKYFETFDISAVAGTRDGRLLVTHNPAGYEAAWWGRAIDLGPVLDRARADHGDVAAAAAALRIKLVEHSAALQRTETLVAKLDARMSTAQWAGDVGFFNREYKRRRQQAQAEGRPFMPYTAAKARLRKALVGVAAGEASPGFVRKVFD